jgi:hypothetical protein
MPRSKALWLAAAVGAIGLSLFAYSRFLSGSLLSDFHAFYCAGRLSVHGIDPYRQEPLYSCEATAGSPVLWRAVGHVTDPAPLPPYALALFVPLTLLPYGLAAIVWSLALAGSWFGAIVALRIMTGYSWPLLAAAFIFPAAMSLSLGQIAPVAIALLACAGSLLYRQRPGWAGMLAGLAMIEPHVALPACVALLVAVAQSRLSLFATGAALAALSMVFGVPRNVEYVLYALPIHALSDVPDVGQYSLTVIAHVLGLSDGDASRIGSLWYAFVAGAGVATACAIAKRLAFPPLLVAVPIAFAVFGGPYVHWQQVAAAIPAALLLASRYERPPAFIVAAIVGLAIPWLYVVGWGFLIPGAVAASAVIVYELLAPRATVQVAFATLALAALVVLNHLTGTARPSPPFAAVVSPHAWADASWGAYVRARIPIGSGLLFWLHVPTWCALAAVILVAARKAWRPTYGLHLATMTDGRAVRSLGQGS